MSKDELILNQTVNILETFSQYKVGDYYLLAKLMMEGEEFEDCHEVVIRKLTQALVNKDITVISIYIDQLARFKTTLSDLNLSIEIPDKEKIFFDELFPNVNKARVIKKGEIKNENT